jgi:hypothetical protein
LASSARSNFGNGIADADARQVKVPKSGSVAAYSYAANKLVHLGRPHLQTCHGQQG